MTSGLVDGSVVVLYLIGMVAVGYWGYRKSETLEEYLVAGRNIPLWMYVPVMSAVVLGGASTIGSGGLGYRFGVSGAWLVISIGLGIAALGVLISTDLANLRAYTLGEILERRYDQYSATVGAVIAGVYALTIAITQVISVGAVLSSLFGFDFTSMIVVGGVIITLYTALGGMWSVTLTDFIQWLIMTAGIFLLAIPFGLIEVGGFGGLRESLDPTFFSPTGIGFGTIVSYFLLFFLGVIIAQDIWQRVFTADSPRTARAGNIATGAYSVVYGLATALLGMIALVLLPGIENADLALPSLIIEIVPVGLAGLILAGFISAMMSTADSALLASSTLFTNDVYRRFIDPDAPDSRYTMISRLGIVVLGVAMIGVAVLIGDVINALTLAYNLLTGAIFVPVLGAFFWKGSTWQGAVGSIVVASTVVVVSMIALGFASDLPIVFGLVASLVTFVGVSFVTGPPPAEKLEAWSEGKRERVAADG